MCKRAYIGRRLVILICLSLQSAQAGAELVKRDFLAGIGDFERSSYTRWFSTYKGADYDFAANSFYVGPANNSYTWGCNLPSALDSVANGWNRYSNEIVRPDINIESKIVEGAGIGGSNCQYFALKGISSGSARLEIDTHVLVDASKPYCLHPGDTVTFRFDQIKMSGYSGMPSGSSVKYFMWIDAYGTLARKDFVPSGTWFASEITATVPNGVSDITCIIEMRTTGNLDGAQPGVYVDGAHVYVKRAGQTDYESVEFPLGKPRNIKTHLLFGAIDDRYGVAGDFDVFPLTEGDYVSMRPLNALNPNTKIEVSYSGAAVLDKKDSTGKDSWANQSVFNFSEVLRDHPQWLYPGGKGIQGYVNYPDYTERYPIQIANKQYQTELADRLIERARRFGVSGVSLDDLVDVAGTLYEDGKIKKQRVGPWEVQQFLHAIVPRLHLAGLTVTQNACARHLDGGPGSIYFDPWWVPNSAYPASSGYTANTPDNTPDVFFQEYGFVFPVNKQNLYDTKYWLNCLYDMDALGRLNEATGTKSLPSGRNKYMHMFVLGYDLPTDPAYGIDGWLHFGLCSYLLGQSNWSYLGFRIVKDQWVVPAPDIDLSITKTLGAPDGAHTANAGDAYCRWRRYKPTNDGGVGGVVVVNSNPSVSRTYTIDFDATDESGNPIASGTKIKLKPHTGRIFTQRQLLDVTLSVADENVSSGETVNVTVTYTNKGSTTVKDVTVRVQVPDQMKYVAGSAEKSGGRYYTDTNIVVWTVKSVLAHGTGSRTFRATVK